MLNPQIEEKLKKLKEYYYDDDYSLKYLVDIERSIRTAISQEKLAEQESVKLIVDDANKRISTINKILIYNEDLTTDERKLLIRERIVHQFYLDRFEGRNAEQQFEKVDKILEVELERIKN